MSSTSVRTESDDINEQANEATKSSVKKLFDNTTATEQGIGKINQNSMTGGLLEYAMA